MPVYPFVCDTCGPFELRRGFADAAAPAACPSCHTHGRRVWSPPGIVRTPTWKRSALGREEASAHEPALVAHKQGRPMPHGHAHAPSPPWVMSGH